MRGKCESDMCHANNGGECMNVVHCDIFYAHKPETNESFSSPHMTESDINKIIIYCETGIDAADGKRKNKTQARSVEQVMLEKILEIVGNKQ